MKNVIYLVLTAIAVLNLTSCDDKNKDGEKLLGSWKYEKPYFEFEYAQDSIVIEMYQGKKMAMAVEDVKGMFLGMASEKMGDYFKGIDFISEDQLVVNMAMASGDSNSLHATYKLSGELIEVKLNAEDMKELMGEKADMIPPFSFKYLQTGNQLTVYFDEVYIQTMYATMQDQIISMIIKAMGIDFSTFPPAQAEQMQSAITQSIKTQIAGILDNIDKLRVGFVLQTK